MPDQGQEESTPRPPKPQRRRLVNPKGVSYSPEDETAAPKVGRVTEAQRKTTEALADEIRRLEERARKKGA